MDLLFVRADLLTIDDCNPIAPGTDSLRTIFVNSRLIIAL